MLKRDIEVGQHAILWVRHQRDQIAHMGVGVHIMQPHPRAQLAQLAGQIGDVAAHLAVFPRMHVILAIQTIGAGVL